MKKVIALFVSITLCIVNMAYASSDLSSPVGIWVMACHNESSETFYTYVFENDQTATLYEMLPSWRMTAVVKIKWNLSGENIKYSIVEKDKGYSASIPVTNDFNSNLTFKDGIVYHGKNPMTRIEFFPYSK